MAKALSVSQLQQGVTALRALPWFAELPPVSRETLQEGLFKLAGFLGYTQQFADSQWELRHEVLGNWFMRQYACAEWLPSMRLALLPIGAVPLPASANESEVAQWVEWVVAEDYEHYQSLSPEVRVSVIEGILGCIAEKHAQYGILLARLGEQFLYKGEHLRGFALVAKLETAFSYYKDLPTQSAISLTLGDIAEAQNQLAAAQAWFEKYSEMSEALLREANTPQNRRELSVSYSRLGDIAQAQNQLAAAQAWFEKCVEIVEQLRREANTPQNQFDLSMTLDRLGMLYAQQNQLETALGYYEKSFALAEALHQTTPVPKIETRYQNMRRRVTAARAELKKPNK